MPDFSLISSPILPFEPPPITFEIEMQVCSKRVRQPEMNEVQFTQTQQSQDLNQNPNVSEIVHDTTQDDLDNPIAIRKGVCSCTQHPMQYHLSYTNFPPIFKAFVT